MFIILLETVEQEILLQWRKLKLKYERSVSGGGLYVARPALPSWREP